MIRGPIVVDASVVVEYVVELEHTMEATSFFRSLLDPDHDADLWSPDLLYVECISALRKLERRGLLGKGAGRTAVQAVARLPIRVVGTRELTGDLWQLSDAVSPYDACYVALAARLETTLVTFDEKLIRARRPSWPHFRRPSEV